MKMYKLLALFELVPRMCVYVCMRVCTCTIYDSDIPHHQKTNISRIRTRHGRCGHLMYKWRIKDTAKTRKPLTTSLRSTQLPKNNRMGQQPQNTTMKLCSIHMKEEPFGSILKRWNLINWDSSLHPTTSYQYGPTQYRNRFSHDTSATHVCVLGVSSTAAQSVSVSFYLLLMPKTPKRRTRDNGTNLAHVTTNQKHCKEVIMSPR